MMEIKVVMDNGQEVAFVPSYSRPLGFADIPLKADGAKNPFSMEFYSYDSSIDSVKNVGKATIKGNITFHEEIGIYALVLGGWLPPPLVVAPYFLVDRNVVATMRKIKDGQIRQDLQAFQWWMQLFHSGAAKFNPLCFAIEGGQKRVPTFQEFKAEFQEGQDALKSFLPHMEVVEYGPHEERSAWKLVEDIENRIGAQISFLKSVCPLMVDAVPKSLLRKTENKIFEEAEQKGVKCTDLVFVAALSCLYGGQGYPEAARNILKPALLYTDEHAYNAIADINHLNLCVAARAVQPAPEISLCTCDKAVAQFWCGLNPRLSSIEGNFSSGSINFGPELFPRLERSGREALAKRCGGDNKKIV